jgi:hypothetical protein
MCRGGAVCGGGGGGGVHVWCGDGEWCVLVCGVDVVVVVAVCMGGVARNKVEEGGRILYNC